MTTCSQADYSRRHGVSKVAVAKWARKGIVVLIDGQVDVETSDIRLERYRNSEDPRAVRGRSQQRRKSLLTLKPADVVATLEAQDWTREFVWTVEATMERARQAAAVAGLVLIESDDGYQLRDPSVEAKFGRCPLSLMACDLDAGAVVRECRRWVTFTDDEPDRGPEIKAIPDELLVLAFPHFENQARS